MKRVMLDKYSLCLGLVPDTQHRYVGIEIEFVCDYDQDDVLDELMDSSVSKYVSLTEDGSIDEGGGYGHELRILCKQSEVRSVVKRVCAFLKQLDARVNNTCGLHVHLDMRKRDQKKAFNNLVRVQDLLYKMCPIDRKMGNYCRPVRGYGYAQIDLDAIRRMTRERYNGINHMALEEHRTLEVRIHHGTLKASEIINWVEMLTTVIRGKPIQEHVGTVAALPKVVKLNPSLFRHVCRQVGKYAKEHHEVEEGAWVA